MFVGSFHEEKAVEDVLQKLPHSNIPLEQSTAASQGNTHYKFITEM